MKKKSKKFPKIVLPFPIRSKWKSKIKGIGRGPGVIGAPSPGGDAGGGGGDGGGGMGESVSNDKKYTYKYSCAMLNLSEKVAPIFTYWAKKMIQPNDLFIDENMGIEGYEDLPHTTVKYGIHDVGPEKLIELIKGCGSIPLTFGKVTKFDNNPLFDVIKVDVDGEKLQKLNQLISENMENTDVHDQFKAHVTLAYVQKGACEDLVGDEFFNGLTDEVDEIYFTSRTGEEHYLEL